MADLDGWDDDDDALAALNDDNDKVEVEEEEEENGWGDSDDGLEDLSVGDDDGDGDCGPVVPLNSPATAVPVPRHPLAPETQRRMATATTGIAGWESEDVAGGWNDRSAAVGTQQDDPERTTETRLSLPPPVDRTPAVQSQAEDGWDDEDDLDLDDLDDDSAPTTAPPKHILTPRQDAVYHKLQAYIQRLPHLVTSLNAVLEAEYNTATHAMALLDYYEHRPQLMAYTVDVEVPRMDYRVKTRDGRILTDKLLVQQHLQSQPNSILLRASNQSLLADILTVLHGDVICPQFLATAICTSCQFRMDESMVDVECSMSLSLPNAMGARTNVATMLCHVMLDPTEPMVMYQIKQIVPAIDSNRDATTLLQGTAMFLLEMGNGMGGNNGDESSPTTTTATLPPSSADALRDQCLQQLAKTHYMAQQTSTGLSSALRQIDRVANVSTKVNALSKLMPTLPNATDILHQEEHSPVKVATAQQQQQRGRPKPILGGFLMSGLSRLANTIVPDNSPEPSFYRKEESQAPVLYRNEEPKGPSLYRKEESHAPAPALYRRPDPPQRPAPRPNVEPPPIPRPPPPNIPPHVQDGWDEEDEELNFDDDDDDEPVRNTLFESPARLGSSIAMTAPSNPSSHISSMALEKQTPLNPPPPPRPPPPVGRPPFSCETSSGRTTYSQAPPVHISKDDEDLVAPIPHQDYPPIPPPMLNYNPQDDIIPTRVRWTRSR